MIDAQALLAFLGENPALELSYGEIDNDLSECDWRVHRRRGGINDREWDLVAHGETPFDALTNARATVQQPTREGKS